LHQSGQIRSTDAGDYQDIARPVAVMAKEFAGGARTNPHKHRRGQLLYAVRGIMTARTSDEAWIVPPRYALWIPPETLHSVEMREPVAMRTVYIGSLEATQIAPSRKVIGVSPLLHEAILALMDEPVLYCENGRGGALAKLIVEEIARAAASVFELPLPSDRRLMAICEALIGNPALGFDIDDWAGKSGMSRRNMTRKFRAETSLSFAAWRRRLRAISAAARMSEGVSQKQAAHDAGYQSPGALGTMMRKNGIRR
jgi:AraC-like DNA-binding protein/quercetin dioxygenase-like cupin family protein